MFTDQATIKYTLEKAKKIYCIEDGNSVPLVYDSRQLVRITPFGGLASKPVTEVREIRFNHSTEAWEVIF